MSSSTSADPLLGRQLGQSRLDGEGGVGVRIRGLGAADGVVDLGHGTWVGPAGAGPGRGRR